MLFKAPPAAEILHVLERHETSRSEDAALKDRDIHPLDKLAIANPAALCGRFIILLVINVKWHDALSPAKFNKIAPNCAALAV